MANQLTPTLRALDRAHTALFAGAYGSDLSEAPALEARALALLERLALLIIDAEALSEDAAEAEAAEQGG